MEHNATADQTTFAPVSLEHLRSSLSRFAQERQWEKFHTPRNLILALVAEVGELAEIFQWRGEVQNGLPDFSTAEKHHVGQELSDVLLYLIRLADVCGVDLGTAVLQKLAHNAAKYPADKCRGKSDKYTAYLQQNADGSLLQDQQQQQLEQQVADQQRQQHEQLHQQHRQKQQQQHGECSAPERNVVAAVVATATVEPTAVHAAADGPAQPEL